MRGGEVVSLYILCVLVSVIICSYQFANKKLQMPQKFQNFKTKTGYTLYNLMPCIAV